MSFLTRARWTRMLADSLEPLWGASALKGLKEAGQLRSPPPYGALGHSALDIGAPEAGMHRRPCARLVLGRVGLGKVGVRGVRLGRIGLGRVARRWLVNVLIARRVVASGGLQEVLLRSAGRLTIPRVGVSG